MNMITCREKGERMREILFRGKRKDNGEWVEGYLLGGTFYYGDREMVTIVPIDNVFYPRCEILSWEEVIPETVGQFTGLFDKNGIAIFEGDIVKCCGEIRRVTFETEYAWFDFDENDPVDFPEGLCLASDNNVCEIIGNIHDNPELLEAKE